MAWYCGFYELGFALSAILNILLLIIIVIIIRDEK